MKAWHTLLLLFLAFMATWCATDWFYVGASRAGKKELHRAELVFLIFPVAAGLAVLKKKKEERRVFLMLLSFVTSLGFGAACVVWVLYFGIPFHFWIGGTL